MKSGTNVFLTWTKYTLYPSNRSGNMFVPGKYVEFSNKFASGSGILVVCSSDIRYNGESIHALNNYFVSDSSSPGMRHNCQNSRRHSGSVASRLQGILARDGQS